MNENEIVALDVRVPALDHRNRRAVHQHQYFRINDDANLTRKDEVTKCFDGVIQSIHLFALDIPFSLAFIEGAARKLNEFKTFCKDGIGNIEALAEDCAPVAWVEASAGTA